MDKFTEVRLKRLSAVLQSDFLAPVEKRFSMFIQKKELIFIMGWAGIIFINTLPFSNNVFINILIFLTVLYLALSPETEHLFRMLEDVRYIATNEEKKRLYPIFYEVYGRAKEHDKYLSKNINLYIVDTPSINAFSIGNNTIALTRGMINTMHDNQLKGVLAHEFAHISTGDTLTSQLIMICTSVYVWLFVFIIFLIHKVCDVFGKNIFTMVLSFLAVCLDILVFLITLWVMFLASFFSRSKEYKADEFAYKIGYGEELTQALYNIYEMEISDKKKLSKRAFEFHPRTAYRIEAIEQMLNIQ